MGIHGINLGCTEQKLHYHGRTGAELGQKESVCSILAVQWKGELRWRKCTEAKHYREGSDFEEMDWGMR